MSLISEIKCAAAGNWPAIFKKLMIPVPEKAGHSACPVCGTGKDRFHYLNDDKGSSYCRRENRRRDGIQLAIDTGHTLVEIARCAGVIPIRQHNAWSGKQKQIPEPTRTALNGRLEIQKRKQQGKFMGEVAADCIEAAILWREYENGRSFEETRHLFGLTRKL